MADEELEDTVSEKPEDFVAPVTGEQQSSEEVFDAETKLREHQRITSEIEKIKALIEAYSSAKTLSVEHPGGPDADQDLANMTPSLEDNGARIDQINKELAETGVLSFRKKSELKMQLKTLQDMSLDQGGDLIKNKNERNLARDIVREFEGKYGSEEEARNRISALEEELEKLK